MVAVAVELVRGRDVRGDGLSGEWPGLLALLAQLL